MGKIKLEGYVCERCRHKWVPQEITTKEPKVCPKCKSPYWNVPRKNDNKRASKRRNKKAS